MYGSAHYAHSELISQSWFIHGKLKANFFFYYDKMEYVHNAEEDTDDDEDPFVGKSEYILSEDWDFVVDRKRRHGDLKVTMYF